MTATGFALFPTALGECGIVWGPGGVLGMQLPEANAGEARRRLVRRFPEARAVPLPPEIAAVTARVAALLGGEADDLATVALDWSGVPDFERKVYDAARAVPPGMTTTYGAIAIRIGSPGAARAVGRALGQNPFPIVVPCHRVLAADGKPGGFSAAGGVVTKLKMLAIENAADPDGQRRLI